VFFSKSFGQVGCGGWSGKEKKRGERKWRKEIEKVVKERRAEQEMKDAVRMKRERVGTNYSNTAQGNTNTCNFMEDAIQQGMKKQQQYHKNAITNTPYKIIMKPTTLSETLTSTLTQTQHSQYQYLQSIIRIHYVSHIIQISVCNGCHPAGSISINKTTNDIHIYFFETTLL